MSCLNFNQVIIAGKLTADPELKTTTTGITVTSFTVAVNFRKNRENGQQDANFFNVVAWKERAEFVTRYFRKGSTIMIVGKLQNRSWNDNAGNKRSITEIVADSAYFVDSKNEVQQLPTDAASYIPDAYQMPKSGGGAQKLEEIDADSDDLPF